MKVLLLLIFLGYVLLNAQNNYERTLYETVLPSIFQQKPIKVYVTKNMYALLINSDVFNLTNQCDSSVTLLIGQNFSHLPDTCKKKPIFATDYKTFKNNNSIGAFYWRKGRPQIKFKASALKKFHLFVPAGLEKYVQ